MTCAGQTWRPHLHNAAVLQALRHRQLPAAFAVLALLAQLILPLLHAQDMAQRSGNPLLYAFCGTPASVLSQVPVPDSLDARILTQSKMADAPCALCASLHAPAAAAPALLAVPGFLAVWAVPTFVLARLYPRVQLVVLPPLRAPPLNTHRWIFLN